MKKIIALVLTALMLLTCSFALAESELPFEGSQLSFEDYGFAITLPDDWNVMEVPQEAADAGFFFITTSPDGARTLQLQYSDLDEAVEGIDAVVEKLSAAYEDVAAVQINGIDFAAFTLAEQDINALVCTGGSGTGLYCFYFTPASDEAFGPIAQAIAGSIMPLEDAAE